MQSNPSALPHQLRVGNALPSLAPGPGQSVALIAPQFNNLGVIGHYRRKVINNEPNLIAKSPNSDKFMVDYIAFLQQCPDYVQNFQITDNIAIISVQTNFVRELFGEFSSESVFHNDDSEPNGVFTAPKMQSIFRHGMITDAAHKFFHNGKLLETCAYFETPHRWQPILVSWIGKENTETYAAHFLCLFMTIASQIMASVPGFRLSDFHSIISSVVNFSDAQRAGFEVAYGKFMTSTQEGL